MKIRMTQILAAPWDGHAGRTYSLIGLSDKDVVYRYDNACNGWVPYNMDRSDCARDIHEHGRKTYKDVKRKVTNVKHK